MHLLPHVYDSFVKAGAVTSLAKMRELLRLLVNCLPMTYLILDGLDECDDVHQKQILAELETLTRPDPENQSHSLRVKILVCSRETKEIARRLGKTPQISLSSEHEHVSKDIAIFTRQSLSDLYDRFDREVVDDLNKEIVGKADGE